jgi:hypothetical protein
MTEQELEERSDIIDTVTAIHNKYAGTKPNMIVIDEAGNWPHYNWYSNPIKWWRLRKLMKTIDVKSDRKEKL